MLAFISRLLAMYFASHRNKYNIKLIFSSMKIKFIRFTFIKFIHLQNYMAAQIEQLYKYVGWETYTDAEQLKT